MINIAIIEDETEFFPYYNQMISEWTSANGRVCNTVCASSAEEFLFKYQERKIFDIILLDIRMDGMDGMQLARKIREYDESVKIIFLTGDRDNVLEGYEVNAIRYLLKPIQKEKLMEALNTCVNALQKDGEDFITVKISGESTRIYKKEIISIKVDGHYIHLHAKNRDYTWKATLKDVQGKLERKRFVMVNRSEIVNLDYVEKITREQCVLENGDVLPISRGAYPLLNDAFMRYYF